MNLIEKLSALRKSVEVIEKSKSGYGYTYAPEEEILAKITVQLSKLKVSCLPKIVPGTTSITPYEYTKTKIDKVSKKPYEEKNNEVIVNGEMIFTWIDNENPDDKLEVPWIFTGMQADVSQAFGSALTYCTRYFYLKFFNIATQDDPDSWRSKQKAAEAEEDKAIAAEIIKAADELVKDYVKNSKDEDAARKKVLDVSKKYIKSGNYLNINNSKDASTFLEEVKNTFEKKEK